MTTLLPVFQRVPPCEPSAEAAGTERTAAAGIVLILMVSLFRSELNERSPATRYYWTRRCKLITYALDNIGWLTGGINAFAQAAGNGRRLSERHYPLPSRREKEQIIVDMTSLNTNQGSEMTPGWLIDHLCMTPHLEGGHYVETFRDPPSDGARGAVTCIHFLLQAGELSAWHRVDAIEIWHFAAGDPLALTLSADGHDAEVHYLGADPKKGQHVLRVVPKDCWQTAETMGRWTLVSCIVAPAFAFAGFEMAPADWRPTPRPSSTMKGS